jgi:sulfotransferase
LLCNVLNQNPRFHASSTSCVAQTISAASAFLSQQDEMKSALAHDKEGTERRVVATLRGMMESWYSETIEPVVFDKSRAWNHNALLLEQLYPDAKLVIVVRDLRAVFASIEKQHRKNPALMVGARTVAQKAATMFERPGGMIGGPICGIEDILRRSPDNIVLIKYESLVANPKIVLRNLYNDIGEEWFDHDLDNVESVAIELDALWLNKYPHEGSGKIEARDEQWSDWISPDIASGIMQQFSAFNGAFGYV